MKIVLTDDEGKEHVFSEVTDVYFAIRQLTPMQNKKKNVAMLIDTKSYSWGGNLRDLVKEINQSSVELQALMKNGKI